MLLKFRIIVMRVIKTRNSCNVCNWFDSCYFIAIIAVLLIIAAQRLLPALQYIAWMIASSLRGQEFTVFTNLYCVYSNNEKWIFSSIAFSSNVLSGWRTCISILAHPPWKWQSPIFTDNQPSRLYETDRTDRN